MCSLKACRDLSMTLSHGENKSCAGDMLYANPALPWAGEGFWHRVKAPWDRIQDMEHKEGKESDLPPAKQLSRGVKVGSKFISSSQLMDTMYATGDLSLAAISNQKSYWSWRLYLKSFRCKYRRLRKGERARNLEDTKTEQMQWLKTWTQVFQYFKSKNILPMHFQWTMVI